MSLSIHVEGDTAFNSESAQIERYGNGFLLIPVSTGRQVWVPDYRVNEASWEKV